MTFSTAATALIGLAIATGFASCSTASSPPPTSTSVTAQTTPNPASLLVPESIPELSAVEVTPLVEGLEHPWSLAWLPNGDLLITERPGRLRLVRQGKLEPTAIAGLPADLFAQGQGGLLDIAVDPQFEQNRWVYFSYAAGTEAVNRVQVARGKLNGLRLENVEVIFTVRPDKSSAQHFGSRLAWLPDRTLLIAIGDGGNPPVELNGRLIRHQAQMPESGLGKIHRINRDGSIPADNPFRNQPKAQASLWSLGHRNIQGLAVDPQTGTVWSTEHGSRGGDELNQIKAGENYGWPEVTFSQEYWGAEITPLRTQSGMIDPHLVWTPAIAPSGITVYRGTKVPDWQGKIFAGGLVGRDIRVIQLSPEGQATNVSRIPIGARVRDVRQGPSGDLYVLTDESSGKLIRVRSTTASTQS
ncbi:PQQ-dependent sugar dehydrogenase [Synechococcus elongatus]|uniref:PQQ-dependent sugar dehydrogenase n=1 Tax=Synechococcus elongatus TaxID=32046 RepID=UPI000F7F0D4C|nr:PQQ-dependent sugar dehydrogenase [Synechococcus elongatus]